jgi:hypothetical protein
VTRDFSASRDQHLKEARHDGSQPAVDAAVAAGRHLEARSDPLVRRGDEAVLEGELTIKGNSNPVTGRGACVGLHEDIEGKGLPTPGRIRRQREILIALSKRYAALPKSAGGAPTQLLRPIASFGFSMRTSPEEAVAKLVELLDDVDPAWRSFVKVWDGVRGGVQHAVRA